MIIGGIDIAVLFASLMVGSVPILLAALGETVVERSGVLNLGVEGMMIIGAVSGFIAAVQLDNPVAGFLAGAVCGALFSLIFAALTQGLLANQVATGLALTLFGIGISSLAGQGYNGIKPPATFALPMGPLRDIPFLGPMLFRHDWVVWFSLFMVAAVWFVLNRTRAGLIIRAVGESHEAAHALGYKVNRIRLLCILFGGAMAGMGGAYISLVRVPQWTDNMTNGVGWIALAIVVFASWRPGRVLVGAWLFGGLMVLGPNLQAAGYRIPVEYLSMAPYLITIVVLVVMSSGRRGRATGAPAALGQNFHASR
ncbi:ABC transporter permease [Pseudogemmobacter humi]|uniref:Branched-chain amino acid transport system / permease component n=1 Tax=Pseudogemmobacter humi TaxID=2483812 RepID=A0A3P5XGL1_9RHOB|nr:ABC transporter permease [Pseudogemmobacter humi]VDC29301.1 Branched-chain amino acid transport system / permease component [Pseudogemmobacter humi]